MMVNRLLNYTQMAINRVQKSGLFGGQMFGSVNCSSQAASFCVSGGVRWSTVLLQ